MSRVLKFFMAWSAIETQGGIKNFTKRGLPLEQPERPCESLDTTTYHTMQQKF